MYRFHPFLVLSLFVMLISNKGVHTAGSGTFWHVSDIHVDQNYSNFGDTTNFCHRNVSQEPKDIGLYGNFLCDTPQILVNITIDAMSKIQPKPDFIIWTGDNLPHVWEPPGWLVIYEALNNITDHLRSAFPTVPIYPSIGNHDSFPPDDLIADPKYYIDYLKKGGWEKIIPESAWPSFQNGGFYSVPINPNLRLISLNTILWYKSNNLVKKMADPAGQFQWLDDELSNATLSKEKVYIIGHVPPGFYNKVAMNSTNDSRLTYHSQFLEKYLNVTGKYYNAIAGQFFGHLHLDTFQLFQFDSGVTRSSSLLASSVTPWYSKHLYGLSLPVNPSIRLMHYESNGTLADYDQYFLNLTKANQMDPKETPEYEPLYTFTKAYNVSDVSTASLYKVYENLKSSDETFKLFNHYMTAGEDTVPCDEACKRGELCGIICTSQEEYIPCTQQSPTTTTVAPVTTTPGTIPATSYTTLYAVMGSLIVVLLLVALIAFYRIRRKGPQNTGQYQRFPDF